MIAAFAPLWIVVFLGWAASRTRLLGAPTEAALTRFAFSIAIPPLVFTTLVKLPADRLPLVPLAAFALSACVLGLAGYLSIRGGFEERVMAGMASSYVNSGNLGIPVALYVLGDASLVIAIVAWQTIVLTPLIVSLIATERRQIWLLPLRVPVVLASLTGLVFMLTGLGLPGFVMHTLELLAAAAVPVALFALGMSLHLPPGEKLSLRRPDLGIIVLLKVVAHPVVAFLVAHFVFGLDGPALIAVTLFAGLPTAQNAFIYAGRYDVARDRTRDAVFVTSVVTLGSLSLIMWLLS